MVLKRGAGRLSRVALGTRMAIIISYSWQNQADWFFLGRDFAHMVRTTWKQSKPCIFVLEQSRQFQTLQLKQQKQMWILSFFIAKLPEKLKRLKFYLFTEISKMDDEDKHSPSEVNIILNIWKLLMQKLKQESPKSRRPKTIFNLSTNRKVQTQTATDMNTGSSPLHWSLWYENWENWKLTCVRAWPLFVEIFDSWTHGGKTEKTKNRLQFPVFSPV